MKTILPKLACPTLRALCAAASIALAAAAVAAPVRTEHVEAELVAARTALVPGEPLTVALRLGIDKGWHTYWQNPGDSGLPTTLEWTLPRGVSAGPIEWPAPRLLPAGPLLNYGYENEALHLVTLTTVPDSLSGREVTVKARADWLVCKETCIPEGADLALTLPVANKAEPDPRWGKPLAEARASLPRPLAGWQASAEGKGATIALKLIPPAGAADPGEVRFFAYAIDRIEPSSPQKLARDGNGYVLTLPVATTMRAPFGKLAGVVTAPGGFGDARAATIEVAVNGAVTAPPRAGLPPPPSLNFAPAPIEAQGLGLALALVSAFIGGMLLNLMPCVFPVLSIKVLGFATHHDPKATLHREAVAFAGGVILTFVGLGLLLAALRAAGEQLGWGFQLQSPSVVTALAILFFALALNLSGVFEFGQLAPSSVAEWSSKNRTIDAFGSGVLAVVIASPCTAPFMGAALGFALAGGTTLMLAVFVVLGLGMALPYVLLAWFPGWRRRLPAPGPWLVRFKQLLAFPLYATVIWLAWVLGAQRDNDAVLRLFASLLALGFALWAWRIVRGGGARPWGIVGAVALAGAVVVAWPLFAQDADPPARNADASTPAVAGDWLAFTPTRVTDLTAAGRPVFIDFTAAWCVTCQVNKRLVLNTDAVRDGFAKRNVALVRADWTRRDPTITMALTALGRSGVPVYVLHRPGKPPLLLPEVLQQQTVLDALATL
jgi:thiol:disulfide interchange protein DsbD